MSIKGDIRLSGFRTLARVIEQESITAAARHLGITPSAVSKQIRRLENEIGVLLLQRTTRRIRPTEAGLKVYHRTRPLVDDLVDVISSVASEDAQLKGVINMAATPTFGRLHLVPVLAKLSVDHPHMRFNLKMSEKVHDLIEDETDIAIREGGLDDSSMHSALLRQASVQLYASPGYLRDKGNILSLNNLSQHELILARKSGVDVGAVSEVLSRALANPRFVVNDLFSVRDLALAGVGVAGLPDYVAEPHIETGDLVRCLPDFVAMKLPIHAVYPSNRFLSKRVRVVLDELKGRS